VSLSGISERRGLMTTQRRPKRSAGASYFMRISRENNGTEGKAATKRGKEKNKIEHRRRNRPIIRRGMEHGRNGLPCFACDQTSGNDGEAPISHLTLVMQPLRLLLLSLPCAGEPEAKTSAGHVGVGPKVGPARDWLHAGTQSKGRQVHP